MVIGLWDPAVKGSVMKQLTINKIDFELAFELSDFESSAYLDRKSGAVVIVEEYALTELEKHVAEDDDLSVIVQKINSDDTLDESERAMLIAVIEIKYSDNIEHYELIPKQDSRNGYRDMQEYIWSLEDESFAERLEDAIHGRGAFRRFKDILGHHPDALQNWFKFRDDRELQRIIDWLESIDVEPVFE